MAMSDDEAAAEVKGVELYKAKLKCFLIAACVTAIAGAVMYLSIVFIKPSKAFSIDWTVAMVFVVIIGGIGTIEGPIVGSIIYVFINQKLFDFPGYSNIILGVIAILVILFLPKGIMGTLHDLLGFEFISVRRSPPIEKDLKRLSQGK
jgi:branched-chain amino acid transport system permease protein